MALLDLPGFISPLTSDSSGKTLDIGDALAGNPDGTRCDDECGAEFDVLSPEEQQRARELAEQGASGRLISPKWRP